MKVPKNSVFYLGISLTLIIGSYLTFHLFSGDKTHFLSGDTSYGHYQFEVECNACHVEAFADDEMMQDACESCHADELEKINDSHPKSVFTDPRNAELLSQLDARYCITCHREHKPEITRDYGVTLANDFCFHCHQDVAEERQSHQGMEFRDCTTSGCHNFHDNSMLYEKFLIRHIAQPDLLAKPTLPKSTGLKRWLKKNKKSRPLEEAIADIQEDLLALRIEKKHRKKELKNGADVSNDSNNINSEKSITQQWQVSIHAKVNANCSSCHLDSQQREKLSADFESPSEQCADCHEKQQSSFMLGKHGMRYSMNLEPMSTDQSRLNVDQSNSKILTCISCHNPHSLNIQVAAVDSCLSCHQDKHSKNYKQSKHFALWQDELAGEAPLGSGVSCASCHLPRIKKGKRVTIMHNQNFNLRPNTKMLKKVCMNCHGLRFSLSSLANEEIIENNFSSGPNEEHPTFKLIEQRIIEKQKLNQSQ